MTWTAGLPVLLVSRTGEYVGEKHAVPKQRLGPEDLVSTWLVARYG
ncbi:hypothetical protein RMN56_22250 [Micromonospora halotolerans]|uniref:Uncharacterized protein n=1 Tax=Micromonospora halotolerans TaxID=709879 RepID=A0ABY9ZSG5_9ACTN|nr:hypothetical protein [Micromonospora halotolerans]WNM37857.1 hypothetical protein RMN56_22250 [Micromonospora halotolerans]